MTRKIEIELTEEEQRSAMFNEPNFFRTEVFQNIREQIRKDFVDRYLPKKKSWKFLKGNFSAGRPFQGDDGKAWIQPIDFHGPEAYCFTREKLEALLDQFLAHIIKKRVGLLYLQDLTVERFTTQFLAKQEEV